MRLLETIYILFVLIGLLIPNSSTMIIDNHSHKPTIKINIDPFSTIYEGDIINCEINGNPYEIYWTIDNKSHHTTFFYDDPVVFNPESTPLSARYVNFSVVAKNEYGMVRESIPIILKKIYFGDLHFHTIFSEGDYHVNEMYANARSDNYLDFAGCTDHATMRFPLNYLLNTILNDGINLTIIKGPWEVIKESTRIFDEPGNFSTILGYEWSGSDLFPGGYKISPYGNEDVGHIIFYYQDVYPTAEIYSMYEAMTYDDIFKVMAEENKEGNRNIGFVHHTQGKIYLFASSLIKNPSLYTLPFFNRFVYDFTTNFSFLAKDMIEKQSRDDILRGVEVYSRWGTGIGPYSNLSVTWPYFPDIPYLGVVGANKTDAWAENGMWEWSEQELKNTIFVMQMGGETHHINRPGSAFLQRDKPAGIMAAYAVHNTHRDIWDAMNNGSIYGSQLLKIRANVRFNGQMILGNWMNCSLPLTINISAMATFPGFDNNGKTMCPYMYPDDELENVITDIWLIKKDTEKGRPWCKIIGHVQPNKTMAVAQFKDENVKPNDFYYVAIRQNGAELIEGQDQYTAFLGPVFIDKVIDK